MAILSLVLPAYRAQQSEAQVVTDGPTQPVATDLRLVRHSSRWISASRLAVDPTEPDATAAATAAVRETLTPADARPAARDCRPGASRTERRTTGTSDVSDIADSVGNGHSDIAPDVSGTGGGAGVAGGAGSTVDTIGSGNTGGTGMASDFSGIQKSGGSNSHVIHRYSQRAPLPEPPTRAAVRREPKYPLSNNLDPLYNGCTLL